MPWACKRITTFMLLLAFVTHVFLTTSQTVRFGTRFSYMFQLMLQAALCTWHSLHSMLGLLLALPTLMLCVPARRRRRTVPCRRIGRRRFRLPRSPRCRPSRSHCASWMLCFGTLLLLHSFPLLACCGLMLTSLPFGAAIVPKAILGSPLSISFVSAACARLLIHVVLLGRSIAHRIGLLATRVGEASHPGPSGTIDPWASYLEKKRHGPTANNSKSVKAPARSLWIDCEIDLTQFQDRLVKLTPDILAENSTGVILLSRPMFSNLYRIRSTKPLVAVLPGGRNDELPSLGFAESSYAVHYMFIKDPVLDKWSRKLTTIIQLGAVSAFPTSLDNSPEWTVSDSVELSATLSQRLFASPEDWSSFISTCRKSVPSQVFGLHSDLNSSCVDFYGWTRFDKSTHRVFFRAPAKHKTLILCASGLRLNFIVQEVCRDTSSKQARDAGSTVVWLGKRSFADATLLIKQVDSHLGLALSQQSFGLRVPVESLATVRKLVSPDDSRFQASNLQVRGRFQYEIIGLPPGCSRSDVITNFASWKHGGKTGWAVIPLQHWFVNGQSHWLVSTDVEPQCHFLHL